nr:hypothetical protein [Tanacetum cinerariifolium]
MSACHDVDINCLHFNVRRLLDFVDVFGYFDDTACPYLLFYFPGKFRGYKSATKEEVEENEGLKEVWEQIEYLISNSDSDLESTASS